ncbi:MAG: PEP-utilizing enzyme [Candidatus Woesearchaeota archaeon]
MFQSNEEDKEGKRIEIFSGKEAEQKADELNLYKAVEETKLIQGISANNRRIGGIAKVIRTNLDFGKIRDGDIIIASMTRQDYVPHIRKAGAIVTNEGGITCHAAIIARELGIPCIVGAEDATEIINDGDLIFIDGEKGSVEVISKGHRIK